MKLIDLYNPKKIKENWKRVQGSPYSSLKFQFYATKAIIIGLIAFVCYQLLMLIIYGGGSWTGVTMITRLIIIVIMVLFSFKAWGMLAPLKLALSHYEKSPNQKLQTEFTNIDVKSEVDSILKNFDEKGKKRGDSDV
jgi:hypothetical protein